MREQLEEMDESGYKMVRNQKIEEKIYTDFHKIQRQRGSFRLRSRLKKQQTI